MRRMGIYLGLVEDDDTRGYGRYDARQSDQDFSGQSERRHGRYGADDGYSDRYGDEHYADGEYDDRYGSDRYRGGRYDGELEADEPPVREPEPLPVRRVPPSRPLGVAPVPSGGSGGGGVRAGLAAAAAAPASVAVREPAPAPEPAPAAQPYRITTL